MKENEIIGNRYKSLDDLKLDLEKYYTKHITSIFESESEQIEKTDFMIDYELENDDNVYTLFYLKDTDNNYYITEL